MKKILCLLLVVILLFLSVGCNSQEQPSESASGTASEVEQPTEPKETEPKIYDNTPYENDNRGMQDWGYAHIETLLRTNTDIVKATYVGTVKKYPNYLHDFEVKEVVKGTCEKGLITVFADTLFYSFGWYDETPPVLSYSTIKINYEVGKDYLLLLSRNQFVCMDEDRLDSIDDSLTIPLDEKGNVNVESCKLYNTDLMLHIRDTETEEALKNGTFIDRLLELTKDNPTINKAIDTTYKEPIDTINEADCVLIIRVEEKMDDVFLPYYVSEYRCEILDNIKGDCEGTEKSIQLPTEKIEVGKTYLVALNKNDFLWSRNAIFPCAK